MSNVWLALWFFLPAGMANASPVFAAHIPGLNKLSAPMDLGKSWRGQRLFGDNKTWRGFIIGVVVATLVIGLQKWLFGNYGWAQTISGSLDYSRNIFWALGPLLGLGALLGDAIESCAKRQRGHKPGDMWFPMDQIDYIIGGLLLSLLIVRLTLVQYTLVLIVWFLMHIAVSFIGYNLGLKSRPI